MENVSTVAKDKVRNSGYESPPVRTGNNQFGCALQGLTPRMEVRKVTQRFPVRCVEDTTLLSKADELSRKNIIRVLRRFELEGPDC